MIQMAESQQKSLLNVRHVFLDMDGTIYHGTQIFPTTEPFLNFLSDQGIGYTFLSNNSSYGIDEYIARLARFGLSVTGDNFYISTDYAIDYLKKNCPEYTRLYVLGMPCLHKALEQAGYTTMDDAPQAVIVGFDRMLTYEHLCRAAWFLRQGVPGIATHPDVFCPTDQPTWLVDCGAVTACLEKATNTKLTVLGKPNPGMLVAAAARKGLLPEQVLMCGDRLSTDIAIGVNAGAMTCHVTTPGADLVPPKDIIPDYAVTNLGELQKIWEGLLSAKK